VGSGAAHGVSIQSQADIHIGVAGVGFVRLLGLIRMAEHHDVGSLQAERPGGRGDGGVEPAAVADGHPPTVQGAGRATELLELTNNRNRLAIGATGAETVKHQQGGWPTYSVHSEPGIALKLVEGGFGVGTKQPVHPPGVEAERTEASLQRSHVVPPQHRLALVQEAVTEAVPRFDEGRPCLGPTYAVSAQSPLSLERPYGGSGAATEACRRAGLGVEPELGQALLEV